MCRIGSVSRHDVQVQLVELTTFKKMMRDDPEYQEIQQKVSSLEKDVENYISASAEMARELRSANNKAALAESTSDRYAGVRSDG